MAKATARICAKGHRYFKSSSCPTCPVCEAGFKPANGFLSVVSAPARRALEAAGIHTLSELAKWSKKELLQLHGFGPSSLPTLQQVLKEHKLDFRKEE
ncbi:DNA-directed RNA polymerase subunit alpha C-terminal domain-containing protein [Flavihumibacter sp. CACIAM 22H1]|uniref:DNA-directed RNA polymerase subunit alpha C-terminal domain-containing protein n=1 Tax=Flavihumibacter sp. CACIAM 22H1 TaxID=1812911 RepID=UPI0007A7D60E|nr:DNA-directed RNA polymerase subunit alpha C-terminal domain-containing protein [Flavihumibacter sp. CACIAM 22H1]KYP14622.1 MAG: hypothetical protein A1D16_00790 [Flavihumibacter sp. CACIAM 22H1]